MGKTRSKFRLHLKFLTSQSRLKSSLISIIIVFVAAVITNRILYAATLIRSRAMSEEWDSSKFKYNPIAGPVTWCEPFNRSLDHWKHVNFMETSGEKCLRIRQACAIESAARANPDLPVIVRQSSEPSPGTPEKDEGAGLRRDCDVAELLSRYPNVRLVTENLSDYLKDTPLWGLYASGAFTNSTYSNQHLSDAVRIAILYKYGGIYLDTDVMIFRPLHCLVNAAGVTELHPWGPSHPSEFNIENNVLVFEKGHPFLWFYMEKMVTSYQPDGRSSIGPPSLTENFQKFCRDQKEQLLSNKIFQCENQSAVTLLGTEVFHPIEYALRNRYYSPNFPEYELEILRHSLGVHAYDSQHGLEAPETSLFFYLAKNYCPAVLNYSMGRWKDF